MLARFVAWASGLCTLLKGKGYFADFCDPASGLPHFYGSNRVYADIEGVMKFRKYRSQMAGNCKMVLHPEWGPCMYPATLFTTAPNDVIMEVLKLD